METQLRKIDPLQPEVEAIRQAAAILEGGGLVAVPTETVYGIACRAERSFTARLDELKGRPVGKPYTLHIARKDDVRRYVPRIDIRARKLVDRGWPGPLTLVFELGDADLETVRLELGEAVFEGLYAAGSVGIRCPDHRVAAMILSQVHHPVVMPSANISGHKPAVDGKTVYEGFKGAIEMVLDAGRCKYGVSSTIVKIGKKRLEVVRQGCYSAERIETMSKVRILLVCTGNTCRSPMAEGLFRKYLAGKLGCALDEVEKLGYKIESAGVMGISGAGASAEAVAACAARAVDINGHRSRKLSRRLVEQSDLILVMTNAHREAVLSMCAGAESRCQLLAKDREIPDPIGRGRREYENCAAMIEQAVRERVSELVR